MSTRRRAEEFADLVDGARPADSAASAEAHEFYAIVARLRDVETPAMRAEFAADLRARLMSAASVALADLPPPTRAREAEEKETRLVDDSWSVRGLRVATTTLLVCATAGGVAAASQSALPGDPLYQVKRGLEWVQVATAGSDEDRGDVLLDQASERLAEAERLAISRPDDPRTPSLISGTLDDFAQQATDGSDALVDDYRADGDAASIVEVREFADESSQQLDDLGRLVPPDVQRHVVDAADVLTDIDSHARDTCETCSALEPLHLSSSLTQLAASAQSVLDVLPGELGSVIGAGSDNPTIDLPTLPPLTGGAQPTGDGQTAPGGSHQTGGANGGRGDGDSQQPQLPLPTGGATSAPSIPLPSIPGLPLPSVPLPSLPLPSLPLPSLPIPTLLPLP
jgi:hypothetical protein